MLFLGSGYITGNISPYVASYYQLEDTSKVSEILPTNIVLTCCFLPIGTMLVQRNFNPKVLLLFGGCLSLLLFFATTMVKSSFMTFYILYAFAFGIPQGLTYMVPVHHAWLAFPDQAGLISGLILGGFGFGALIFDNVSTAVINPNDDTVDD